MRSLQKSIKNNSHKRKCLKPRKPTKVRSQEHAGNNGPPVRQIKSFRRSDADRSIERSPKGTPSLLAFLTFSLPRVVVREGKFEGFARPDMPKPSSSSAWVPLLCSPFLALPRERNVRISGGGTSGQRISEQVSSFSSFGGVEGVKKLVIAGFFFFFFVSSI